jgi:hypothetical protein
MRTFIFSYVVFILVIFLVSSVYMISGNVFGQSENNNIKDNKPNILVIMGDDFGFSDLGVFGSEISTPILDQLQRKEKS